MYRIADFTRNVRGDLLGGITAAVVALPLALAFGISSGAGPVAGIYGAIIVGLFAAVFGGTPTQISGPTGPMTVVMTAMIAQFAAEYPEQGLTLAFTTVFLAGLLQAAMGMLRLGRYIIMVPYPVISGFMSGIGVIIILLEIGPLLGFDAPNTVLAAVRQLPDQLRAPQLEAAALGALTLVIVFLWRGRPNRIIPSPLLALIVGTLATVLLEPGSTVARIGEIPTALPALVVPSIDPAVLQDMLINAVMLAVLGSIDSLLTSLVADNLTATQHDSDRELVGQGLGNAVAGLFGALPGAGATMRTVVNIRAGSQGPLSGVVHALLLFAIAAGLGFAFEDIPLAVLAGILIKVGYDILDKPFLARLHRLPLFPVALMTLVFLLTVFVDLITAVFIGVFVKNLVTIDKLSHLQLGSVVLSDGRSDTDGLRENERAFLERHDGEALLLRITGPVSYGVGRGLARRLQQFTRFRTLLVDFTEAAIVGISTAMLVENLIDKALADGAEVKLVGVHGHALNELKQMGVIERVGQANCHPSIEHADEQARTLGPGR
jgi:SulP family sulfate permease